MSDQRNRNGRDRIREAALVSFAEQGDAASIRQIARAAGVSPALIQHHFGTKDDLRAACDEYVVSYFTDRVTSGLDDLGFTDPAYLAEVYRSAPVVLAYLKRLLLEDTPHARYVFDALVALTERYLPPEGASPVRDRAAVLVAMKLGVMLLRPHLHRTLGLADATPAGDPRLSAAQLDLLNPDLVSPEVMAAAWKAAGTEATA
ncbi:MAG: TetR family transcriptional regulator [Propioniciclava sp.]|uniref:TetR family transcriptional regulator n=1 Tax=Propioniciclava sp. TaxID=2038686 RepID=UPI0039E4FE31